MSLMKTEIYSLIWVFFMILMLFGYRTFFKMYKSWLNDESLNSAYKGYFILKYGYYLLLIVSIPFFTIYTLVSIFLLVFTC